MLESIGRSLSRLDPFLSLQPDKREFASGQVLPPESPATQNSLCTAEGIELGGPVQNQKFDMQWEKVMAILFPGHCLSS